MRAVQYTDNLLSMDGIPLDQVAQEYGTPAYVYSRAEIEENWQSYERAFADRPHLICYAVKANANLAVINILAKLGSGFDIVSSGELERVIAAGGDPGKTVFSGVGKRSDEIQRALEVGIKCFNVESLPELSLIDSIAGDLGVRAPISIRVNPDVDARTHPYISTGLKENKFGIDIEVAESVYMQAAAYENLDICGIDCHIGSQITTLAPYLDAITRVQLLVSRLAAAGIRLRHLDIGGGLGICYQDERPPTPAEFVAAVAELVVEHDLEILIEPGRSIVGNAGVLLTQLLYIKGNGDKNFAIVDAAMNDLIRPALYDAWQEILPVKQHTTGESGVSFDVVGPVCETGDYLGLDRKLAVSEGDLLAVCSVGAYGFCMSSNYNARPRAAEIMLANGEMHLIRSRETIVDLYRGEYLLPK